MTTFQIGDSVKLLTGPDKGKVAVVQDLDWGRNGLSLLVLLPGGDSYIVDTRAVALHREPALEWRPDFWPEPVLNFGGAD
jgi:hypothetical protein